MRRTPTRALPSIVLLLAVLCVLAGCGSPLDTADSPSAASPSDATTPTASAGAESSSPSASATPEPTLAEQAYDRMTPQQRVGQLLMIGMTTTGPTEEMYAALAEHAGGNAFLRGPGEDGVEPVREVTDRITETATVEGVRPFVSADQEGGNAQSLEGEGFSDMPTAVTQGQLGRAELRSESRAWAQELLAAGVNFDLAPVADVVPAEIGVANDPIGYFGRQYGSTTDVASPAVGAFVRGMQNEGVATSIKHFPGIGRATGNTDSDATATDPTVRGDELIAPFAKGVRAGAAFTMVSSAKYPAIDTENRACFSPVVIQEMLRGDLGFQGVVISDSFGSASVAGTPPGERAVRFLRAGGTMVLDTNYLDLEPMSTALLAEIDADPAFAEVVEADVRLVLETKERFGLID